MEIRKDIEWYEWLYMFSNFGNVKSLLFGKETLLIGSPDNDWYLRVTLCSWKNHKVIKIHRLVAQEFIGKSDLQVNHIDWDRKNNDVKNLEWCTSKENINHAFKYLWRKSNMQWKKWIDNPNSIKILQKDKQWTFVRLWDSMSDVYRELWIDISSIVNTVKWNRKSAWWYKREYFIIWQNC